MLDGCRTKLFAGSPHRVRTRRILLALHIFHFGRLPRGDALTLELNAVTVMALVGAWFRGHNPQACASTYVNRFDLYLSLSISRIHAHTNFFSLRYHLTNPAYNYTFHHASIGVIFWALKHRNIVVLNTARHLVNTHTHTHSIRASIQGHYAQHGEPHGTHFKGAHESANKCASVWVYW